MENNRRKPPPAKNLRAAAFGFERGAAIFAAPRLFFKFFVYLNFLKDKRFSGFSQAIRGTLPKNCGEDGARRKKGQAERRKKGMVQAAGDI